VAFVDRLDAEHREALAAVPDDLKDLSDIGAARAREQEMRRVLASRAPAVTGVVVSDQLAPGPPGGPEVLVRMYRPDGAHDPTPVLCFMHGGGMVLGAVAGADPICRSIVSDVGCVVASVEYRLAPEHPHPAPIEDCYAGLTWLATHAADLGIDPARIAVGGRSAGGGLAAALALLARDRTGPGIALQWLIFPMLDDRTTTHFTDRDTHPKVWNLAANTVAWHALLGDAVGSGAVSPYAAPARADDLSGLPPAYIAVGEFDLFVGEDIAYAARLVAAGVTTELHVYPGAFHGSDTLVPNAPLSKRQTADGRSALRAALFPTAG